MTSQTRQLYKEIEKDVQLVLNTPNNNLIRGRRPTPKTMFGSAKLKTFNQMDFSHFLSSILVTTPTNLFAWGVLKHILPFLQDGFGESQWNISQMK